MKTIQTKLYSFKELSEEAKQHVIALKIQDAENDPWILSNTSDEMLDTLKSITNACQLRLSDWTFGAYCQNWKVKISGDTEDLEGNKALAWFLNVLIKAGYPRPKKFAEMSFPGVCGFTGVCFDDDAAETVWNSLMRGDSVSQAFDQIAYEFGKTLENEMDYLTSESAILEYLDQGAEIYTEEGEEF